MFLQEDNKDWLDCAEAQADLSSQDTHVIRYIFLCFGSFVFTVLQAYPRWRSADTIVKETGSTSAEAAYTDGRI